MNLFEEMHDWAKKPYSEDMSLKGWIAFIGLLIVITILWRQVINFIID